VTSRELLRRRRRVGAEIVLGRGKGGHVMVRRGEMVTYVPTGSGEVPPGTLASILKGLGLRRDQI
jgi:predicted RNA binding protein YcfA (HicA-like mRNA interferase family)